MNDRLKALAALIFGLLLCAIAITRISKGVWFETDRSFTTRIPGFPPLELAIGLLCAYGGWKYWRKPAENEKDQDY